MKITTSPGSRILQSLIPFSCLSRLCDLLLTDNKLLNLGVLVNCEEKSVALQIFKKSEGDETLGPDMAY